MLLDEGGHYLGDELAVFGLDVSADSNTRTPSAFICEQNRIIGVPADGLAHHSPDKGHVIKCNSNALFKLAKEDPSLREVHALSAKRIAMLNSDISETLNDYAENGVGDPVAWQGCIDHLLQ